MTQAQWPARDQRMPVNWVDSPHPAILGEIEFDKRIEFRFQRRSGPGGQHRNKVSTGAFVIDVPTGVIAEATENRSQIKNRSEAMLRLRMTLAIAIRTRSPWDNASAADPGLPSEICPIETEVRRRLTVSKLKFSQTNPDRAAAIALVLNDLHAAGGQPSLIADGWHSTTSRITQLLKSENAAWILVNQIRGHHGRLPLR
jgi:protein subunit release factor B